MRIEKREGDGIDPRLEKKEPRNNTHRKSLQLCKQVSMALNMTLAEFGDENLNTLYVESVIPRDSSLLVVNVIKPADVKKSDVLAALDKVKGRLRSEVADFICRKRTPQLKFEIYDELKNAG